MNGYYTSQTPSGRKVVLKESYETVFGRDKDSSVLRTLATLNDRLTAIKDQIPNITTVMKLGTNEISEEAYKEMQKKKYLIRS